MWNTHDISMSRHSFWYIKICRWYIKDNMTINTNNKYPLHTTIVTSCDAVSSCNSKTWYNILYQHTVYVVSLSNISIKTNFKQITRVELKLTNLQNALKTATFCEWRHAICCHSFTNVTLLFEHFQCYCTIVYQRYFIWRNVDRTHWNYVLGND